jgi:adenylylsulfate kinase-like enzyme
MSFTLWFTGLPGSGKTTIAELLKQKFIETGRPIELIESDNMAGYYQDLSPLDTSGREIIARNMAICAALLNKHHIPVIVTSTTPLQKQRDHIRAVISSLLLVYCNASEKTVRKRDPKGLYAMADRGILTDFPGPGGRFEPPLNADIELNTETLTRHQCADKLMLALRQRGLIQTDGSMD